MGPHGGGVRGGDPAARRPDRTVQRRSRRRSCTRQPVCGPHKGGGGGLTHDDGPVALTVRGHQSWRSACRRCGSGRSARDTPEVPRWGAGHATRDVGHRVSATLFTLGGLTTAPAVPHHFPGEAPPATCATFRQVAVSSRAPGQSPVLPFACCVGSMRSNGHGGRCSCGCRFRISGAQ